LDFIGVEVKVPLFSIKHHAMNMYGGGNLQFHASAVLATQFVKCRDDVESAELKGRQHAADNSESWANGCRVQF
jgi:hypothetical protein